MCFHKWYETSEVLQVVDFEPVKLEIIRTVILSLTRKWVAATHAMWVATMSPDLTETQPVLCSTFGLLPERRGSEWGSVQFWLIKAQKAACKLWESSLEFLYDRWSSHSPPLFWSSILFYLKQINLDLYSPSSWCQDWNSQPLNHEFHVSITARPVHKLLAFFLKKSGPFPASFYLFSSFQYSW